MMTRIYGSFHRCALAQCLNIRINVTKPPLIHIDMPDPLNRNLRTPDPATGNKFHIPNSGRTLGGQREAVIDPPSKKDDTIIITPIPDP